MIFVKDLTKYVGLSSDLIVEAMNEIPTLTHDLTNLPMAIMTNDIDLLAMRTQPISEIGELIRKEQLQQKSQEEWDETPIINSLEIIKRGSIPRGLFYLFVGKNIGEFEFMIPVRFTPVGENKNGEV